jgi:hypothetical protein
MDWIIKNWELVTIVILLIDKLVALSPIKQDDLIWSSIKKIVKKLAGK